MKVYFFAVVSFLLYAFAVIVGDACSAGSTFHEGLGHAIVFGTFAILLTFPMLVGIGYFLRGVAERRLRRPLPWRVALPWFVHVPLSLALLTSVIPDSPQKQFRRIVADDVPHSLSDVRFWRTRGYGNSIDIMSFRVTPSEFDKVLSRYEYAERKVVEGMRPHLVMELAESRPQFPISLPSSPLVYEYWYSSPERPFGMWIYTTTDKDFAIVVRSID